MLHRFEGRRRPGHVREPLPRDQRGVPRGARPGCEPGYSEFATDPAGACSSASRRCFRRQLTDNGNVNDPARERFIAMTETPIPVRLDGETLAATPAWPTRVPGELTLLTHSSDRASGGVVSNYAAKSGREARTLLLRLRPGCRTSWSALQPLTRERHICTPSDSPSAGPASRELPVRRIRLSPVPRAAVHREPGRWKPDRGRG